MFFIILKDKSVGNNCDRIKRLRFSSAGVLSNCVDVFSFCDVFFLGVKEVEFLWLCLHF